MLNTSLRKNENWLVHCIKWNFGATKSYFRHYSSVVTFLFNADLCRTWHKITWKTIILSSLVLLLLKLFPKFRTKNNIPKCKAYDIYQWQNFFSYKFRDHILSKNEEDDCVFVHTNQRCILETVRRLWWCFLARKLHHRCLTESQIHLKKNMLGKLSFSCNAD